MDNNILQQTIAFCLHIHLEPEEQIRRCLRSLRASYPNNDLYIISEDQHELALNLANEYFAFYYKGDRIKGIEFGGLWTRRYLDIFLHRFSINNLLCRIDPDTVIWRQFNFKIEDRDTWLDKWIFGSVYHHSKFQYKFVLGGCIFFWKRTIIRIIDSEILKLTELTNPDLFGYKPYNGSMRHNHQKASEEILSSQDRIIGYISNRLNLHIGDWHEIKCLCRGEITIEDTQKYAATHPHILDGLNDHYGNRF